MRTLATGIWTSSRCGKIGGFTLIEILVVLLIIGIMITGAVLSTGIAGGDRDLDKERDRMTALIDYLRDQAALQNREYGIRCFVGGYEFLTFEPRSGQWQPLQADSVTRIRHLPPGLAVELSVDGRPIVLPAEQADVDERVPQILLYSSGELNLFELILRRKASDSGVRFAPAAESDRLEVAPLPAGSA
jgi:general secretion pathway protein H